MIPVARADVLDAALGLLAQFGGRTSVRGRFVALYLGLRRMGPALASLGSGGGTPTGEIEGFLDDLYTKTHQPEPFVVLTAPFGGSTSATAPYSSRTGVTAPGHGYPTNTWRNNFGIQKGIGCPAEPDVIRGLLANPSIRLACPHMAVDPDGHQVCSIASTAYRGDEHSIWLRITEGGFQGVDLNTPAVYEGYLNPSGAQIPIFPLIAVLYCLAAPGVYPARQTVGIPDLATDYRFTLQQVQDLFECDPDSADNSAILAVASGAIPPAPPVRAPGLVVREPAPAGILPTIVGPAGEINTGVGAELLVAQELQQHGWHVGYRGNQRGIGYDLEATKANDTARVEVKSSVGFTVPELSEAEWAAAQRYGEEYILAVVDFYGSSQQAIRYLRNPAGSTVPVKRTASVYFLVRDGFLALTTDVEFV